MLYSYYKALQENNKQSIVNKTGCLVTGGTNADASVSFTSKLTLYIHIIIILPV